MNSVISSHLPPMMPIPSTEGPHLVQWMPGKVKAGFPSPAEDFAMERIDLDEILMTHPQATFFMRVSGDSMESFGIFNNDVLVINKGKHARSGQIVLVDIDGQFMVKQFIEHHGQVKFRAGNPTYPDIVPKNGQSAKEWGVVVATVKVFPT
jgi:DNA polymerase V